VTWRGRATSIALAIGVAVGVAVGCSSVPSSPTEAFSIQLDAPLNASILLQPNGAPDTLRDTTGCAAPLHARVFNSHGEEIPDAPVRYIKADTSTSLSVDGNTGVVIGQRRGAAGIVASAGTLQSARVTIAVNQAPDTIVPLDSLRDSLVFLSGDDVVKPLRAQITGDTGISLPAPVSGFLVQYAITFPPGRPSTDTTNIHIVNDSRKPSVLDSTDVSGTASRSLRIPIRITLFPDSIPDSVAVTVTANTPRSCPGGSTPALVPVPGSPITYWLRLKLQG